MKVASDYRAEYYVQYLHIFHYCLLHIMCRAHYVFMEAVVARIPASAAVPRPHVTIYGLRRALGDCLLAAWFLVTMLPAGRELKFSLAGAANVVWLTGAAVIAVMSF